MSRGDLQNVLAGLDLFHDPLAERAPAVTCPSLSFADPQSPPGGAAAGELLPRAPNPSDGAVPPPPPAAAGRTAGPAPSLLDLWAQAFVGLSQGAAPRPASWPSRSAAALAPPAEAVTIPPSLPGAGAAGQPAAAPPADAGRLPPAAPPAPHAAPPLTFAPPTGGGSGGTGAGPGAGPLTGSNPLQPIIVTGPDAGAPPVVKVWDATTGQEKFEFLAYPSTFRGGVRVAAADLNGDGVPDIITAPGPGMPAEIRVWDGKTGAQLPGPVGDFVAFPGSQGAFVAAGDVNGDGTNDIVVGPGAGGGSQVKAFSPGLPRSSL